MKSKYTIKILDESGKTIKRFHHQKIEKIGTVLNNEINEFETLFLHNKINYQISVINNKTHYCAIIMIKTIHEETKFPNVDMRSHILTDIFSIVDDNYGKNKTKH